MALPLFRHLFLYRVDNGVVIESESSQNSIDPNRVHEDRTFLLILKLEKTFLSITEHNEKDIQQKYNLDPYSSILIYGILGLVELLSGTYLIAIISRNPIPTWLTSDPIYKVSSVQMILVGNKDGLNSHEKKIDKEYLSKFQQYLENCSFYFSYWFDLTLNLQLLRKKEKTKPIHQSADKQYFWNYNLLKPFFELSISPKWILPVIDGFIQVSNNHVTKEMNTTSIQEIQYILISRRSCLRAGTRYYTRGSDQLGNVANFVETEQILIHQKANSSSLPINLDLFNDKSISSFVQIRGSIPLLWNQLTASLRPTPTLDSSFFHREAIEKHLDSILSLYKKVVIVSLLDHTGSEKNLSEAFQYYLSLFIDKVSLYVPFDFHQHCKGGQYESISQLVDYISNMLKSFNFFACDDGKLVKMQEGVVRTNCIDCLDRTNVVQSEIGWAMIGFQLQSIGLNNDQFNVNLFLPTLSGAFKNIWADNADTMSYRYTGTGAMKTDFTRTGKRSVQGTLNDGWNFAQRVINKTFVDEGKQEATELFLGIYSLQPMSDMRKESEGLFRWNVIKKSKLLSLFQRVSASSASSSSSINSNMLSTGITLTMGGINSGSTNVSNNINSGSNSGSSKKKSEHEVVIELCQEKYGEISQFDLLTCKKKIYQLNELKIISISLSDNNEIQLMFNRYPAPKIYSFISSQHRFKFLKTLYLFLHMNSKVTKLQSIKDKPLQQFSSSNKFITTTSTITSTLTSTSTSTSTTTTIPTNRIVSQQPKQVPKLPPRDQQQQQSSAQHSYTGRQLPTSLQSTLITPTPNSISHISLKEKPPTPNKLSISSPSTTSTTSTTSTASSSSQNFNTNKAFSLSSSQIGLESFSFYVMSWNLESYVNEEPSITTDILPLGYDIYVVGLQNCWFTVSSPSSSSSDSFSSHLTPPLPLSNSFHDKNVPIYSPFGNLSSGPYFMFLLQKHLGFKYYIVGSISTSNTQLLVFVHETHKFKVSNITITKMRSSSSSSSSSSTSSNSYTPSTSSLSSALNGPRAATLTSTHSTSTTFYTHPSLHSSISGTESLNQPVESTSKTVGVVLRFTINETSFCFANCGGTNHDNPLSKTARHSTSIQKLSSLKLKDHFDPPTQCHHTFWFGLFVTNENNFRWRSLFQTPSDGSFLYSSLHEEISILDQCDFVPLPPSFMSGGYSSSSSSSQTQTGKRSAVKLSFSTQKILFDPTLQSSERYRISIRSIPTLLFPQETTHSELPFWIEIRDLRVEKLIGPSPEVSMGGSGIVNSQGSVVKSKKIKKKYSYEMRINSPVIETQIKTTPLKEKNGFINWTGICIRPIMFEKKYLCHNSLTFELWISDFSLTGSSFVGRSVISLDKVFSGKEGSKILVGKISYCDKYFSDLIVSFQIHYFNSWTEARKAGYS